MFKKIEGKTVLLTGATGLIGKALVKQLLVYGANVIVVVRNVNKAKKCLGVDNGIFFLCSDIKNLPIVKMNIDYIIHAAANTSSKAFIQDPVGIIEIAVEGTKKILELAKINKVKGLVYLSSMEVYGIPTTDEKIDENHSTNLNTMSIRSSYPIGKRLCECLCAAYASQYGVPAKVIRLTQTFGQGVPYDDGRVFAEFARCVIEKKNIVLKTKGETKRNYLFIDDAVTAVLTVLLYGKVGEAYNAANEDTYCSIYEMAHLVAEKCANNEIDVIINEEKDIVNLGYAPTLHMNLDVSKLKALGWNATTNLEEMYKIMIEDMIHNYK